MATEKQANQTLEFHQDNLFESNNLAYLAVVPIFDRDGNATKEYTIEAGIYNLELQQKVNAQNLSESLDSIPLSLNIPSDDDVKSLSEEVVEIQFKQSDNIEPQAYRDRRRPANGGCSISNYKNNNAGTLGCCLTLRNLPGKYILSNWHVMTGTSGRNGDAILQQGRLDGGSNPSDRVATLFWSRLDQYQDAAFAKVDSNNLVTGGSRDFNFRNFAAPQNGMAVKKSGRTTQLTLGQIISTNATVRVQYSHGVLRFTNQLMLTHMSQGGDSGSMIVNRSNNDIVGLLFAGNGSTRTWANDIRRVTAPRTTSSIQHANGETEKMPAWEIENIMKEQDGNS